MYIALASIRYVRVWLLALLLGLTAYAPTWLLIAATWFIVLRYMPLAAQAPCLIATARRTAKKALADAEEAATMLRQAEIRIVSLETDLTLARLEARTSTAANDDPTYRRVGLHADAPGWLVEAARRAYRARLHPDRHPHHRQQAHDRFVAAEAAFDAIYGQRGMAT
ncbi:hypothetical protein FV219_00865 [Methylobacterium sp. WL122]|nr:hypothetical protein FV219_00865 [Methylobacterium sp. WL122]